MSGSERRFWQGCAVAVAVALVVGVLVPALLAGWH